MQISFKADIPKAISPIYQTKQSKENTVAILGSSKSANDILKYMDICSTSVKTIVLNGKNVVHGCGNSGIMGCAYEAGREYSVKNSENKPAQNLAIIANPLWGDEDLDNCIPLTVTNSEAERIERFATVADNILVFPGSATTLQEATTLIAKNYYGKSEDKKKIILVGRDFFKGLDMQYQQLYKSKLIKCRPEELYTIADNEEEIMDTLNIQL